MRLLFLSIERLRPHRIDGAGCGGAGAVRCGAGHVVLDYLRGRFAGGAWLGYNTCRHTGVYDRKSVVLGKRVSVRVDLGGRRIIKNKMLTNKRTHKKMTDSRKQLLIT